MKKPNIVFIFTDQHHHGVMGNAGDPYIKTPNLDRLAEDGMKFENTYTNSPVCVPARMSLLSGQLPIDHEVLINQGTLNPEIPTYAHSMTIGGYQTVLAGRMHLYGADQHRGHEVRLTGDNTPIYTGYDNLSKNIGREYMFTLLQKREGIEKSGGGNSVVQEYDNAVVSDTVKFLKERDDERPLMMTVGLFSPHPPFIGRKERYEYYYNILPEAPVHENFEKNLHPAIREWRRRRSVDDVSKEEWRRVRAAYYANVEFLDKNIGEILKVSKETLGENTIYIYGSDHGESMGINNMIWKTTFFDCSCKVPLIFNGPGIKKGKIKELTCLNDVTRTLVEYGGGPELPKAYGRSLKGVLEGSGEIDKERSIISQIGTYGKNPSDFDLPSAMIRKGKYKLISYHGYEEVSLYNMEIDPLSGDDLGNNKEYDEIKKNLLDELNRHWDSNKALKLSGETMENFKILQKWANTTRFPLMEKFYNGLTKSITPNWTMNPKDNYIEGK